MFSWFKKKQTAQLEANPEVKPEAADQLAQYDVKSDDGARVMEFLQATRYVYRDTTLTDAVIERYQVGLFLTEPTLCDATATFGGVQGNVRFLIVSASIKNLSALSLNPECGHCVVGFNQRFKVVGITQIDNLRQITLLHVPPEFYQFFSSPESNSIDARMRALTERDFAEACTLPADPILTHPDWVARVAHPVGLAM
jgi:hypothetical protein